MARTFSAAANQFVNCGSGSSLDDLTRGTVLAWFRCTSSVAENQMISVKGTGAPGFRNFVVNGFAPTSMKLALDIGRATTGLQTVSAGAAVTLNQWTCGAGVWDMAATDADQRLYLGTLTARLAEVSSYAIQQVGSGAISTDAAGNYVMGNFAGTEDWSRFVGDIAMQAIWNRPLSLAELVDQQAAPWPSPGCVGFWVLDGPGIQIDQSPYGNHGTVTGATFSQAIDLDEMLYPPELMPVFARRVASAVTRDPSPGVLALLGLNPSLGFTIHMPDQL
jgi:hypothetical protein